jgi:hypothetical protein
MVSVLVKLELCQKWDGLGLVDHLENDAIDDLPQIEPISKGSQHLINVTEFAWFIDLRQALANKSNSTPCSSKFLHQVTEKCILSRLLAYLTIEPVAKNSGADDETHYGHYNPLSVSQTKWLCGSFQSLFDNLSKWSYQSNLAKLTVSKVASSLLSLLEYCVAKKPVPIVLTTNLIMFGEGFALSNELKEFDAETCDAIACAIYSQAKELGMLTTNILIHWYPIIRQHDDKSASPIVRFILMEVVSMRILPIIQTFQTVTQQSGSSDDNHTYGEMQRSLVAIVYDAVRSGGLFDLEEFILCTAPLRAAAQSIGIL